MKYSYELINKPMEKYWTNTSQKKLRMATEYTGEGGHSVTLVLEEWKWGPQTRNYSMPTRMANAEETDTTKGWQG